MKLIFFLILAFLSFSIEYKKYYVYGSITKTKSLTITQFKNNYCVYLDTNEFDSDIKNIEIYITIYNGKFTENEMYYESTNTPPYTGQSKELYNNIPFDHSSYSTYYYNYYDDFTYYFKIPKPIEKYLYISVLSSTYLDWGYKIEIGVSGGLALWMLLLIIAAAIILLGVIIGIIICIIRKRHKHKSYISNVLDKAANYEQPIIPY